MNKTLEFQEGIIHYSIEGKGKAVLLLHGFLEDKSMWDEFVKSLAKLYQVLVIDLPGHGKSSVLSSVHSMALMADVSQKVLQKENIENCVVIGHSMGGYVALAFAEKYPYMIAGFGLFHSHSMADTAEAKANRERTIEFVKKEKMGFVNQFIPSLFAEENREKLEVEISKQIEKANQMPPNAIIAALAGMRDRPMRLDVVVMSKVPVLFILGKQDSRIPFEKAMAQAATAPNAQINLLGSSGHMAWLEEPIKSIEIIKSFVALCGA